MSSSEAELRVGDCTVLIALKEAGLGIVAAGLSSSSILSSTGLLGWSLSYIIPGMLQVHGSERRPWANLQDRFT